jgi:hypothetical protein
MINARLVRATLAVASVMTASIVVGGAIVMAGGLLYRRLAEIASPGLALSSILAGALLIGGLAVLLGHLALRRSLRPSFKQASIPSTPDQMIAGELVNLLGGHPVKLLAASLGIGFVLGASPRLRRAVYRSLVE